ncbi:MAG: two-component system OmpR family sensor histidine kinase ChvG [Hyphomonadaceae bacterium]|nr:MAG: two-component system OmpR family sensor histidine kinase ChvG [Hyphomonadaceae bacterium]
MKQEKKQDKIRSHFAFGTHPKPRTGIANKRRRGGIAGIIFIGSFAGLMVLVIGALVFNELRSGLTQARVDTLRAQGMTIASVLGEAAVIGEPVPHLDKERARLVLRRLFREPNARMRLHSIDRELVADSNDLDDKIDVRELNPIGPSVPDIGKAASKVLENTRVLVQGEAGNSNKALLNEINSALQGVLTTTERFDENGDRVISVSVPIQRVRAVVGVLTLESSDVSLIINRERLALVPFILAAILINLLYAVTLAFLIARPLRRLSRAADEVSSGTRHTLSEQDLVLRPDEIGELAASLSSMTEVLQERIDANERFAADVAHEIKNPLASVRSATELLRGDLKAEQKDKLENMVTQDLGRIDRLLTDIANASRLDAELARVEPATISLSNLLSDIATAYSTTCHSRGVSINYECLPQNDKLMAKVREDAISRVIINLLENAVSFAPDNSNINISAKNLGSKLQIDVADEGGGIPDEALEIIFDRFYTHRTKENACFGNHSGLGLSIAKQIIESHDGQISVANIYEAGKKIGANFTIVLPRTIRIRN